MTGDKALWQMRRAGVKPACAWVHDDDDRESALRAREWHLEPNPFTQKLFAHIQLSATDNPGTLDFRCLIGMRVHMVCERGSDRARRVFKALADAEPAFLIALHKGEIWTHGGLNG